MSAIPAVTAARGGLTSRRVQAVVIGVAVLISTAASTLALGLLVDANAPFDHAFTAQRGAHVVATIDPARVTPAQLAMVPGVTATAGPFPEATITGQARFAGMPGVLRLGPATVAGRAWPGGPVDDITLEQGRWVRRPGEIVVSPGIPGPTPQPGQTVTVTGMPGSPRLTVVGIAKSITNTADGWVMPAEIPVLRRPASPDAEQMLYRFASSGSDAAVNADIAALRAALPPGSVLGTQSYLPVKLQQTSSIAPWVPFIVAFGILALIISVLIVTNVVSGAVTAGTRRIGVLKSIGFTPAQVVAAYLLQAAVPAIAGCAAGVAGGNLLSVPLLSQTAQVFGVGSLAVPVWVDLVVPLAMLALTGLAALLPSLRAGRLSAVQAIATGRAPLPQRGYAAHRLLSRIQVVPRPVTIGLAQPFARPTRTAITVAAILVGGTAVTFAAGLAASLSRGEQDLSHAHSEPVQVSLPSGFKHGGKPGRPGQPGRPPSPAAQQRAVTAALRAQPGTARYVAQAGDDLSILGLPQAVAVTAFRGDARWTGYGMITGRWYHGTNEADVNTYFLTATGKRVGSTFTFTPSGVKVRITGEIFDPSNGPEVITSLATLARADPGIQPDQYDVALRPGTGPQAYANALASALGPDYGVGTAGTDPVFVSLIGLITALTLLIMTIAGLGVLNTVVLQTRERAHDLGILRAIGMTPRQTMALVVTSVTGTGLAAGIAAIPAGIALHRHILPAMGSAAQTGIPASLLNVYHPAELALIALSGLVIAAAGALAPASWAARIPAAHALRTE